MEVRMLKRIAKIAMLIIMTAGVVFSLFNFISIKSEAAVYWQNLEEGTDPVTGTHFIKCFESGQACVTVDYPSN